jgi:hypothetical protein
MPRIWAKSCPMGRLDTQEQFARSIIANLVVFYLADQTPHKTLGYTLYNDHIQRSHPLTPHSFAGLEVWTQIEARSELDRWVQAVNRGTC